MRKLMVTVVGNDRPGIVHTVSAAVHAQGCVVSQITQTTLLGQFAGLFAVEAPDGVSPGSLQGALAKPLGDGQGAGGLYAFVTPIVDGAPAQPSPTEPYVVTVSGPASPGLLPTLTESFASFGANIENLRSLALSGGAGPSPAVLVLELTLPATLPRQDFQAALSEAADRLGLDISLQHRDIFEAIHRI
jgi:glycine cleavage system transcriptional repressor